MLKPLPELGETIFSAVIFSGTFPPPEQEWAEKFRIRRLGEMAITTAVRKHHWRSNVFAQPTKALGLSLSMSV